MDARTGTGKVVAEAAAQAEAPRPAVQLSLLGGSEAVDMAPPAEGKRGPGRPAGAENRTTRELRAFITGRYRHPLVTLARIQAQDPLTLAKELGCKPVEALDRINRAAADLAPYLTGKMPVEDANGNAVLPVIQLLDLDSSAAAYQAPGAGGPVLDLVPVEMADFRHSADADQGGVGQLESDSAPGTEVARALASDRPVTWDHGE